MNMVVYRLISLIFSLALAVGVSGNPCANYKDLPNMDMRSPLNVYNTTTVAISDNNGFTKGWYRAGFLDMPTSRPEYNRCGTVWPLYMKDEYPTSINVETTNKACLGDEYEDCYFSQDIKVINCGTFRVYYLPATGLNQGAYCFNYRGGDKVSTYTPPTAKVTFKHIKWEILPQLVFSCEFSLGDDHLWYSIIWSVARTRIKETVVKKEDLKDADLTENDLTTLGYKQGISIFCGVNSRLDREAPASPPVTSQAFFAGIKISNQTIVVPENEESPIVFEPTVPFACKSGLKKCELHIEMKKKNFETCIDIGTDSSKCKTSIEGYDDDDTNTSYYEDGQWRKTVNMKVKHGSSTNYDFKNYFTVALYTSKVDHKFWSETRLPDITVNIERNTDWRGKICSGVIDPHMKTFDGTYFEQQAPGDYLLYRNTNNGQQVQYRNHLCRSGSFNGISPYCMCSLAIQAGRNVFLIDICGGRKIIDFQLCEEDILTVRSDGSSRYIATFPTGTEVRIYLVEWGGRRHFNVNIYPSAKDVNNTEGLCGNLNNNRYDDFRKRDGTATTTGSFSQWILMDHENLLLDSENGISKAIERNYDSIAPWNTESRFCVCIFDLPGRPITNIVYCSVKSNTNCSQTTRYSNFNCYVKSHRRKRRDINILNVQTRVETYRERRSVSQEISAEDARIHCESVFNASEAYHVCMASVQEMDDSYLNNCVLDLQMTDDTSLADEALQLFKDACLSFTNKNVTMQQQNPDAVLTVYSTTCPNNCSNQGLCDEGSCVCSNGFTGSDCSRNVSMPPTLTYLSDNGLCDLAGGPCDDIFVYGDDFFPTKTTKCKFITQHVLTNNTVVDAGSIVEDGIQRSIFEAICNPSADNTANVFVTIRNMSVSNDGISFSYPLPLYIFDSTCQQLQNESGIYSFTLKNDYCFINGKCVLEGAHQSPGSCLICNTTNSPFDWSNITGCGYVSTQSTIVLSSEQPTTTNITMQTSTTASMIASESSSQPTTSAATQSTSSQPSSPSSAYPVTSSSSHHTTSTATQTSSSQPSSPSSAYPVTSSSSQHTTSTATHASSSQPSLMSSASAITSSSHHTISTATHTSSSRPSSPSSAYPVTSSSSQHTTSTATHTSSSQPSSMSSASAITSSSQNSNSMTNSIPRSQPSSTTRASLNLTSPHSTTFSASQTTSTDELPSKPISNTKSSNGVQQDDNGIILYVVAAVATVIVIATIVVVTIYIKGKYISRRGERYPELSNSYPDVKVSDNKKSRFVRSEPNSRPQSAQTISEEYLSRSNYKGPDLSLFLAK